jgi:hypothetical protein
MIFDLSRKVCKVNKERKYIDRINRIKDEEKFNLVTGLWQIY